MPRQVLKGIVVSEGLAAGSAFVVGTPDLEVRERRIMADDAGNEVARFERALEKVRADVRAIEEDARESLGEHAAIIGAYQAFLSDDAHLMSPIREMIRKDHWAAEVAVTRRFRIVAAELRRLPEPLPSRVPDLRDIERRLVGRLLGLEALTHLDKAPRGVILCADDLSPTQTATLDQARILGVVTDRGGATSHAAIMTRHLGIPAVVGVGTALNTVHPGDFLLVDALNGEVVINPDSAELEGFLQRSRRLQERVEKVHLRGGRVLTKDGVAITISANIDSGGGGKDLSELGVAGVGLFRTEFLYLGSSSAPDENLQAEHYADLLRAMGRRPVTFRTMDFGADKWHHRIGAGEEPNPALGLRAIRLSFAHEEVFRAQIRAMLKASVHGKARILFPMITDLSEFRRAKALVSSLADQLRREGVPVPRRIPVGAMIEIPAAALGAQALLREADFLSLGTNDLTQYTLAVDRTNPLVAASYKPWHPAVLLLIRLAVKAAKAARKDITACGEMAGTEDNVGLLIGLGIRRVSMAASRIPDVAERISALSVRRCQRLVAGMIQSGDSDEARTRLDAFLAPFRRN